MSGTITDLSREPVPHHLTVETCIIGSGPGGATAAWELARAGREVLVLEEGGDFTGSALTEREGQMYDRLYMDGGARTTRDMGVNVMQGRVLGGGSVINMSDVVAIHDGVLRHWQKRFGLTDFSPQALAPYRRRALDDLAANQPSDEQLNANNRLLQTGARALGWRGEIMLHNRVGCAGVGECLIGCPIDAKRNARFVAIPNALDHGARFFTRARVVRIENAGDELKTVRVRLLDTNGYRELGEVAIRAKVIILAANAVGTAQLLLRSGVGSPHVGRHLSLQPQLPILALYDQEVRFFRGIPQSYVVTHFEDLSNDEHGWWGFRIEAIAGTPGIIASLLPFSARLAKDVMARFRNLAAALLLLPDDPIGRVTVDGSGRLRLDYVLSDEQKMRYRNAAKAAARAYFASGARKVLVPVTPPVVVESAAQVGAMDAIEFRPATVPLISAHQQGTVRFAPSQRDGGANPDGLVYGTRDVYVFDSSGFPTSASSHIMAPIITVSRYLSQRLLTRLS